MKSKLTLNKVRSLLPKAVHMANEEQSRVANLNNMKTLEEIKKEFIEILEHGYNGLMFNYKEDKDKLWSWIESTISQTKQELIEEIIDHFKKSGNRDAKIQKSGLKFLEKLSNK